jgi:hypothetical protein
MTDPSQSARSHALRCRSTHETHCQTTMDVFCARSEHEGHGGLGTGCASIASWRSTPAGPWSVTHTTIGAPAMRTDADADVTGPFKGGGRCSGADSTEQPQIGAIRCA